MCQKGVTDGFLGQVDPKIQAILERLDEVRRQITFLFWTPEKV
jgi:hypothetical protein